MEHPILNPPNPYVGTLRIFPGTLVKVAGRPRPNATRFAINFQTGPSINPRDNLALHLSPCFTPPRVVRNSLQHGAWGLEEAWGNGTVVNPHEPFEIMILAEPEQFKIAINGMHYCDFRHRIPFQEITNLTIDGDVDIDRISIISSSVPPSPAPFYNQPTAPPTTTPYPPYPSGTPNAMPMPPMYPNLPSGGGPMPSAGPYPTPSSYNMPPAGGPAPAGATYMSGYPHSGPSAAGGHQYPPGGPNPAGASYQHGGYPVSL